MEPMLLCIASGQRGLPNAAQPVQSHNRRLVHPAREGFFNASQFIVPPNEMGRYSDRNI
jgi:hypothetical protein